MERDRARLFVETRPEEVQPAIAHCQALARELGIWLHLEARWASWLSLTNRKSILSLHPRGPNCGALR